MKKLLVLLLITSTIFTFACRSKDDDSQTLQSDNTTVMQTEPKTGDTIATMTTNHGEIKILLYTKETPETAKNFVEHAKNGRYDNTIIHRVVWDFMIQGGDIDNKRGRGGYSYHGPGGTLEDEFVDGLEHIPGAISMANRGPNTGGSQFFIVHEGDNKPPLGSDKVGAHGLNGRHAVFGYVFEGMDVVDKIANVETQVDPNSGENSMPVEDVVVEKVEISEF